MNTLKRSVIGGLVGLVVGVVVHVQYRKLVKSVAFAALPPIEEDKVIAAKVASMLKEGNYKIVEGVFDV